MKIMVNGKPNFAKRRGDTVVITQFEKKLTETANARRVLEFSAYLATSMPGAGPQVTANISIKQHVATITICGETGVGVRLKVVYRTKKQQSNAEPARRRARTQNQERAALLIKEPTRLRPVIKALIKK